MRAIYVLCVLIMLNSFVHAGTYQVKGSALTDTVYFASTAKLEFIEGITNAIQGSFLFDPSAPQKSVTGILRVDLATLETTFSKNTTPT